MNQYPPSPQDPSATPQAQPQPAHAPQSFRVALPTGVPYLTYTIIGITALVYVLQVLSVRLRGYAITTAELDWLEYYGAKINELIRAGQLWRLLTPMLLHASVPHIFFNMYALIAFGPGLERNYGRWRFVALYLLAGFAGNVLSFLLTSGYSVGASTAIFGLVGAEGIFLYQNRKLFRSHYRSAIGNLVFVVVANLLLGFVPGIDHWGHVGGLLGGLLFAWFASPVWEVQGVVPGLYVVDKREPRDVITGAALVILIFGALAVWGIVAPIVP